MREYSEIGREPRIGDILQFKKDPVSKVLYDKKGKKLEKPYIYKNLYNDTEEQLKYHCLCVVTQVSEDTVSIKRFNKKDDVVSWFDMEEFFLYYKYRRNLEPLYT